MAATSAAASIGSFVQIAAGQATGTAETAIVDGSTSTVAAVIGSFTPVTSLTSLSTSVSLPVPSQTFVFTNTTTAGQFDATLSSLPSGGIAQPTGGAGSNTLLTPPGLSQNGTDGSSGSLRPIPGSINDASGTGSLLPVPGLTTTETDALAGLPTAIASLTTLTTVSDGVTRTLITAPAAAQQTGAAGGLAGVGTQTNGTTTSGSGNGNADGVTTGGAAGGARRSLWMAVVGGAVGVLAVLMV